MIEVRLTVRFRRWLLSLKDEVARTMITARIDRLAQGNPGKVRSLGAGLSEMKVDHGPEYRVYFAKRGLTVVIILYGGDKTTQTKDIKAAQKMIDKGEFE